MTNSEQHSQLIQTVKDLVRSTIEGKPHLEFFCSDACVLRFLRARNMDAKKAATMLDETLKWYVCQTKLNNIHRREENKMHEITLDDVRGFFATGKVIIGPVSSRCGRPVLLLRPRFEDTPKLREEAVKHFGYQMEMVTRIADKESPDAKIVAIIDYTGWTLARSSPLSVSLAVLKMLQYYYPERLHLAIWWHAPVVFNTVYKLIKPFVDPVTAKKVQMFSKGSKDSNQKLDEIIDTSKFDSTMGGEVDDVFDFNVWEKRLRKVEGQYAEELIASTAQP